MRKVDEVGWFVEGCGLPWRAGGEKGGFDGRVIVVVPLCWRCVVRVCSSRQDR